MTVVREWFRRLWYLLNRRRFEQALREDMDAHRSMMASPQQFGGSLRLLEQSRDAWGWGWLDDGLRDVRLAARSLRRTPGFTMAAVGSLGVGLALAVTTFAVVNAYLLRSLPFPSADRLYHVVYAEPGQGEPRGVTAFDWSSLDDVIEFADRSTFGRLYLREGDGISETRGVQVVPGVLQALGVQPAAGRLLDEADFARGGEEVLLVSHAWWRTRLASDPNVIGRTLRGSPDDQAAPLAAFRVIGVLPPDFRYASEYSRDVDWVAPLRTQQRAYFVRLREGVPQEVAEQRLTEHLRRAATLIPDNWPGVRLEHVQERYLTGVRSTLVAMLAAAGLVLAVVCVNLAVLTLLRSIRRHREVAVRVALGAGRGHIVRALVAESGLICLMAVVMAVALSAAVLRALAPAIETQLGRPVPGGTTSLALDGTALLALAAAVVFVTLVLSLVPLFALQSRRLRDALAGEGRGGTDHRSSSRLRSMLVMGEVAGSLALLVGCGLMIETVRALINTDLGFTTDRIARARFVLPARAYPDTPSQAAFYDQFLLRIGPDAPMSLANLPPFFEPPRQRIETDGTSMEEGVGRVIVVGSRYFELLGIPLVAGRRFADADRLGSEPVAIVGESLAARLWPGRSAVGRRLRTAELASANAPLTSWRTVVGVVRDVHQTYADLDQSDVYLPYMQAPGQYSSLYLRTDQPSAIWMAELKRMVAAIDPQVLVAESPSMTEDANRQLARPQFLMTLLTVFAVFATALAVAGLYGVTAYAVEQREREIAIRQALGASGRSIVQLFVIGGSALLGVGIALGLAGAYGVAMLLRQQLYGVAPLDVSTLTITSALMAGAGLLAMWWPAWRASRRNPALRLNDA